MKVLVIVTAFPRSERDVISPWLWITLRELSRHGVDIEVLSAAFKGLGDTEMWGLKVRRWRYGPPFLEILSYDVAIPEQLKRNPLYYAVVPLFLSGGFLKALSLAKSQSYDLLHVNWPIPLSLLSLPFGDTPKIMTFHHSGLTLAENFPFLRKIYRGILEGADAVTVNSGFTRRKLLRIFPGLRRVETIPWPPGWETESLPEVEPEEKRILFVGRLVEVKGVEYLLRAHKLLRKKFPDVKLAVVGDGPLRPRLEKLTDELGLRDSVVFTGWKTGEDIVSEYLRASLVVVPSIVDEKGLTESLGVVAIEAMAFGRPVVASDVGGLPDVVTPDAGILVPQKDPEALASAIEKILSDRKLARELSEGARRRFREHFSKEAVAARYHKLYQEVVGEKA